MFPLSFDIKHLHSTFFKDDMQVIESIQQAMKLCDFEYPLTNGKGPHGTEQQNVRQTATSCEGNTAVYMRKTTTRRAKIPSFK
jgi:hypothetical protein